MFKALLAAVFVTAACVANAQIQVVDRSPASMPKPVNEISPSPQGSQQQTAELYYQLQVLQQEVLELRGLVEQQTHELKRLKQQRLDDYLDLDRRLSQLGNSGAVSGNSQGSSSSPSSVMAGAAGTASPADELKSYRDAIDLVLKKQDYDAAVVKLKAHLDAYPGGRYAGNALYWLGEIYLLKGELEQSRQWFTQLLADFPEHPKLADTQFKLGKVYHLLGDNDQARVMLEKAAQAKGNAAALARDYLKANFNS